MSAPREAAAVPTAPTGRKPKALIISAGIATDDPDLSGGDVRFLEIARHWLRSGVDVHMLTPTGGQTLCRRFGISPRIHLLPKSKLDGRLQAVLDTLLLPFRIPKSVLEFDGDLVYSTNEQLYDVIPGLFLKLRRGKKIRWAVVVHWLPPFPPWKRNRSKPLHSILYFINERLSVAIAKRFADVLLPVSDSTAQQLLDVGTRKEMVAPVECGIPLEDFGPVLDRRLEKKYDAVFMKRVQAVKGALDLPVIWKDVLKKRPDAKLLVIGFGEDSERLKEIIAREGLSDHIHLAGMVYDLKEKISLLCQSRLFILPSYEENWAIVIGEAMAARVPVIAYGLKELTAVWGDNIKTVPTGDTAKFAEEILRLLDDRDGSKALEEKGFQFVKRLDWGAVAQRDLDLAFGSRS